MFAVIAISCTVNVLERKPGYTERLKKVKEEFFVVIQRQLFIFFLRSILYSSDHGDSIMFMTPEKDTVE